MGDGGKTKRQLTAELTELRQRVGELEATLQRRENELRELREEFRVFTYAVSHDLRSPLINLKGFSAELRSALDAMRSVTEPLLTQMDEADRSAATTVIDQAVPEALGFIESAVADIDQFVSAILKLSRLSRRELRFELVDVEAIVREALGSLVDWVERHRVKVTVGKLPQVVADRLAVEEIVGSVLANAAMYLDADRPGEIEITAERRSGETVFYVRDNGRGIAATDMNKVFAPFRRAGKRNVPGEGMGLVYAQALLRRHRGRIWCESELGAGTTFGFTISDSCREQAVTDD